MVGYGSVGLGEDRYGPVMFVMAINPLAKVRGFFYTFDKRKKMVDIVEVQTAVNRIAKTGTSGYDSTVEFVAKANEVNIDAMNILTPHYGKIKAVTDILNLFVTQLPSDFTSGLMGLPDDFYGYIDMPNTSGTAVYPIREIKTNQIGALSINTIRKPTAARPKMYIAEGNINLLPPSADVSDRDLIYFRLPGDVDITTTPVGDSTDDYDMVTAQTNYEWPARMKNLLIYLLVERLGGEMKQPILFEIAQLGIKTNLTVEPEQ